MVGLNAAKTFKNIMRLKKLAAKDLFDKQLFEGKAIGVYKPL